jgi:hypothetical protein
MKIAFSTLRLFATDRAQGARTYKTGPRYLALFSVSHHFGTSEIRTSPGTRSKCARLFEISGTEWRTASAAIQRSENVRVEQDDI